MVQLKLEEIARVLESSFEGKGTISEVCIDSRNIVKGCLFIAVKGERFDGHDFVADAIRNGAAFAVCERYVEGARDKTIIVPDTRQALLKIAAYYRRLFNIHVVGITGSVGKTTTKEMVYSILSKKYNALKTLGNKNNEIGLPQMIFRLDEGFQAAVFEMGMSDLGEISRLSRVAAPTLGIITNIGLSHIEFLHSRENILKAKMEILDGMSEDAPLLLNGDDDLLWSEGQKSGRVVKFFGIENEKCDFRAFDIKQTSENTFFKIKHDGYVTDVTIPAMGLHNVMNATAAFAAGAMLGVEADECAKALAEFIPEGMRQKIVKKGDITVIEDCYNAGPDSMRAAIKTLASMPGRKIAVLGDMLELGDFSAEAHTKAGEQAARAGIDFLFTTGRYAQYYLQGAAANAGLICRAFKDKLKLADALISEVKDNDVVLFKASRGVKLEEVIALLYKGLEER